MKKIIAIVCLILGLGTVVSAQNGITIVKIEVNADKYGIPDGSYTVFFEDPSILRWDDRESKNFTWYLSYKGKRVSDYYYNATEGSPSRAEARAIAWPGEVPKDNEKFVTAQLGKEPALKQRDPRDDD